MGFSLLTYLLLAVTGGLIFYSRKTHQPRPPSWRLFHIGFGVSLVGLVLLLLAVGIVGTIGHFGSLGHSIHQFAGLTVVALVLISAASASQIHPRRPWIRRLHIGTNIALFVAMIWVLLTGWVVVQKYLP